MKKVVIGAMAVLALTACSNEEVIQTNEQNQEISFTAVTGKALSRAVHAYCNNDMPDNFNVWANVPADGGTTKIYFSGDQFDYDSGTNTYKNHGDVRYWPNGKINLFACKNATPEWSGATLVVNDFTVADDVDKQVDFIYAVENVASKPTTAQPLNFRHALSQIEFNARNENSKIYVEVKGVKVCRVANKNTFTFPTASTKDKVGEHNSGNYTDNFTGKIQGTWGASPSGTKDYSVTLTTGEPIASTTTSITVPSGEWDTNTMILMPQTITPWNPGASAKPSEGTGTYFLLNCKICNIASSTYDPSTDVQLWPASGDYGEIAIPAPGTASDPTVWEQGKRYIYTFVFTSTGNGGTDPGTGDEVLTPITLNVTVDDFVKGAEEEIGMTK